MKRSFIPIAQLMKQAMEDEDIVQTFKEAFDMVRAGPAIPASLSAQDDPQSTIAPDLSGNKRAAGNAAFQKKKDQEALNLYSEAAYCSMVTSEEGR